MKRFVCLFLLLCCNSSYANWFQDIIDCINKQAMISNGMMGNQLALSSSMLSTEQDMQKLLDHLNDHMTSHSGYGNYQFHDYQSYGGDAKDWSALMVMADRGQGSGELGQIMGSVSKEFPSDRNSYNRGVSDSQAQRYYAVKSQTMLAARAASQLDYNKIQDQIAYQQMLLKQVEKTKDLKAAMDLSNRIQIEGNLIHLEILRQSAFINQQQAMSQQGSVISALSNAKFLTKKGD